MRRRRRASRATGGAHAVDATRRRGPPRRRRRPDPRALLLHLRRPDPAQRGGLPTLRAAARTWSGSTTPDDAVSPYHRWEVTFSREEFDAILGRGETLAPPCPSPSVERLGPVDEPGADLRVTGTDGTEVVVDSVDLRSFVSSVAPSLYPDRFPTARADGLRPLPTTLPSSRFEVAVGDDEVVVSGRGWGHGGRHGAVRSPWSGRGRRRPTWTSSPPTTTVSTRRRPMRSRTGSGSGLSRAARRQRHPRRAR